MLLDLITKFVTFLWVRGCIENNDLNRLIFNVDAKLKRKLLGESCFQKTVVMRLVFFFFVSLL